jgi:hypothetical protein
LLGKLFKLNEIPKSFSDIFTPEKLLPIKNVYVKYEIKNEFNKLKISEKDILLFYKNVQQHYIAASKHILKVSC